VSKKVRPNPALQRNWPAISPILLKAKLWIPPHISIEFIYKIKEVIEKEGSSEKDVEQVFIQYFGNNNGTGLRELVDNWENIPQFKPRMKIIRDALQAHIEEKYTLSVPALLPQIEGIAGEILGKQINRKTGNKIIRLIRREFPNYLHTSIKDILIIFIEEIVYRPIIFSRLSEEMKVNSISETYFLNRHAILHGVFINYDDTLQSLIDLRILY
jgi:hypothetical protein